jgi:hypothetical protein
LGLVAVWDVDGVVWLVPSYDFTNADGHVVSVEAVTDEYLQSVPAPAPDDQLVPVPAETVTVDGSGSTSASPDVPVPAAEPVEAAPDLIGLDEASAATAAKDAGWEFRVVKVDGEPLVVTADFNEHRLNADIDNGIVVAITVG